ncbi:MAG TPA: KpsF/GutQ family sugar-phosphate isomerase [Planctomycetota bacterium]|nr:KpsF/GutQ family sugar-phosphate isomerase [Planctomycetota bacterium]
MDPRLVRAREILDQEAAAVRSVAEHLDEDFLRVVDAILALRGRVVTAGMGKAGKVAEKISVTLASTGTPSIFLHPAEAIHGDLGRVVEGDLLLALSKSGETEEVLRLLGPVKAVGVPIVAMTQSRSSSLGRHAHMVLETGEIAEAGSFKLAPSASTTAMLALGDALALVVQEGRNFGPADFARFHPGGDLGRRLMKVGELMRVGERNPVLRLGPDVTVLHAVHVMTKTPGRPGATSIVDGDGRLVGFFTDGDLRRLLDSGRESVRSIPIEDVMTRNPRSIGTDCYATEALAFLHQAHIDQLPVVDADGILCGLLDVQDLLHLRIG